MSSVGDVGHCAVSVAIKLPAKWHGGGLVDMLQGARQRFHLWKISACWQGAREAWAMVKTRYTKMDPNHMAEVGPAGPDGQEIPVSLVYDQVALAAKYSL